MAILMIGALLIFCTGCGSSGDSTQAYISDSSGGSSTSNTLSGTVYGRDGMTPLQGAQCTLTSKSVSARDALSATTDSAGKYSITGVPSGTYSLRVSKDTYVALNLSVDVSADTAKDCSIINQGEWSLFAGSSHPYDPSYGYVIVEVNDSSKDSQKSMISGVDVDHYPADFSDLGHVSGSSVNWSLDETTSDGKAVFYKVAPGAQYTVHASKAGYQFNSQETSKASSGSSSATYTAVAGEIIQINMIGRTVSSTLPAAIKRVYDLRPFKGLGYTPYPSDYVVGVESYYFHDSDFWNNDSQELWGNTGRDDINTFAQMKVNFLHLYDWNQKGSGRLHDKFLNYCREKGIYVTVPVSNWYIENQENQWNSTWWPNFVAEAYPNGKRHEAVLMWCIGNEWDNYTDEATRNSKLQAVVNVVKKIIAAEDAANIPESERIAIIAPVTTACWYGNNCMGAGATAKLKEAFESNGLSTVFANRFIAAVQGFQNGTAFKQWIGTDFPKAMKAINNGSPIPFMLTEMGWQVDGTVDDASEQAQALMYEEQLKAVLPFAHDNDGIGPFMGTCVHQALNAKWKTGTEATFGIYKIDVAGTINNGKFPVDTWKEKPNCAKVRQYYH